MNGMQSSLFNERFSTQFIKFASIFILAIGTGVVATRYSPFIPLAASLVFTGAAIGLYMGSQISFVRTTILVENAEAASKTRVLFYVLFLGFFLSITIPKSGKTLSGVPITTANAIILLALVCWLISILVFRKSFAHIPLIKPLIVFIAYGIGASLIGFINNNPRKPIVLDFIAFVGFIPLYFLACHLIDQKKQIHLVIGAIVLGLFLVCGYGILQKQYGVTRVAIPGITEQSGKIMFEGVGRWNVIEGGGQKLYSTFQNGNIFGNHLATFIPFLGGILLGLPSSKKRLFSLGVFLLSAYILILTYSRGAMMGTASGVLALAFVAKKIRLQAILVLFLIVALVGGVLYQYSDRPELTRYDIRRVLTDPDRFSAGRLGRAEQVILGFNELPLPTKLFGLGFGGILTSPLGWRFEYVDNLYLSLLFKIGIVGVALLFWALGSVFWTLLRLRSQITDVYFLGIINGGIAGLFASLIHNLADTLWFFPPLSANFWFLAGITMAAAIIGSRESVQKIEVVTSPPKQAVRQFNLRENKRGAPIPV